MDYKAEIHAYIAEILQGKDDNDPFADNSSLLNTGRIDSMDVVDIFLFLEKKFGEWHQWAGAVSKLLESSAGSAISH